MPKKGEKRPDDVHMAEKEAIEALIPVQEPEKNGTQEAEEVIQEEVTGEAQAPLTKGPPGAGAPALASAIEDLVPYAGEENSQGGDVDIKQAITLRQVEKQVQQVVAAEGTPQSNEVIAKLQAQLDELRGEVATIRIGENNKVTSEGPAGYPWQYYKRPKREGDPMSDWIVCGPGGPSPKGRDMASLTLYSQKGHLPITAYGPAPIPSEVYRLGPGAQWINILQNGGAKEFPINQVLTLKWHLKCPVPGVRFPATEAAIAEGKVKRFVCPDCDLELWFEMTDDITPLVCFRHMRSKRVPDDGRHGISRQEAREVMADIGVSIGGLTPIQEVEEARQSLTQPHV